MASKTREIANTLRKGQIRYHLYKDVIGRYLEAMKVGFYLEAITLMESLITDRLESALIYYELIPKENAFLTLGCCLNKFCYQGIISDDLYNKLNSWRETRNVALHEMAKIEAGEEPDFNTRYKGQQIIAQQGYELFNEIKKELK